MSSIAMTWDAIYRLFPDIRSRINFSANGINDTQNVMTMDRILHEDFGEFRLFLGYSMWHFSPLYDYVNEFQLKETLHHYKIKK